MDIRHLVISGGALKGLSFLGSLESLIRVMGLRLANLQSFVGASIGSVICALLVIGYTPAQLAHIGVHLDFASLLDPDVGTFLTHYGIDSGHRIVAKLQELFLQKGVSPNITLGELYEWSGKRLVITIVSIGEGVQYLDHRTAPDESVVLALRKSVGIPFLLTAIHVDGHYYVDGGLLNNVPVEPLAKEPTESILILRTKFEISPPTQDTFDAYLWAFICTVMKEMDRLREKLRKRSLTVTIEVENDAYNVGLGAEKKRELVMLGYRQTMVFLQSGEYLLHRVQRLPTSIASLIYAKIVTTDGKKSSAIG